MQTAYVACYVESGVNTSLVGEIKCECKHCEPIPTNHQGTQYNAPIEMGTSTSEPTNSSLSYWEYESIQSRCVRLQEKNDELRSELEREVKLKLETLSQMQKELAKGELAAARVDELIKERGELRASLELARERAERVYFQKGTEESIRVVTSVRKDKWTQFILDANLLFSQPLFSLARCLSMLSFAPKQITHKSIQAIRWKWSQVRTS